VPILYQTWGRCHGDRNLPVDDFHSMTKRLREGYHAAAENAGNLVVVPVGDAWEAGFFANRGADLFMDDGSHPSPLGNHLTAATFYQTIYGGAGGE
jgi:lysophospholipase L1-like esterase